MGPCAAAGPARLGSRWLVALLVLLPFAGASGCGGRTPILRREARPGAYDRTPPELRVALTAAVKRVRSAGDPSDSEAGLAAEAAALELVRAELAALRADYPLHLPTAVVLQDVELRLLELAALEPEAAQGGADRSAAAAKAGLPNDRSGANSAGPAAAALRDRYWRAANESGAAEPQVGALAWVLAARLEDDEPAALRSLESALERDPNCVWAHYGRANVLMRGRQPAAAAEALERALRLDPGHLPTRRLWAAYLSRSRREAEASAELAAWLEDSRGDPLTSPAARVAGYVDRALVLVQRGRPEQAAASLDALLAEGLELDWRGESVLAAAFDEEGRSKSARISASRARSKGEDRVLPRVQAALVVEKQARAGDAAAFSVAEGLWEEVLALTDADELAELGREPPPGALLWNVMATAHLDRLRKQGQP